jgi:hypothetical protein
MRKLLVLFLLSATIPAWAADYSASCKDVTKTSNANDPFNKAILAAARSMPQGLGYDMKNDVDRIDDMKKAVTMKNGKLSVEPEKAGKTFCTEGSYMCVMKAYADSKIPLAPQTVQDILPQSKKQMPDGVGFWGRWNADGPGPGYVVKELQLGSNFSDLSRAHPGDIMTIEWAKNGDTHSTIFDSIRMCGKEKNVCFWASSSYNDDATPLDGRASGNNPGFSLRCNPISMTKRFYFSRITHPENINNVDQVMGPKTENYRSAELAPNPRTDKSPKMTQAIQNTLLYGSPTGESNAQTADAGVR